KHIEVVAVFKLVPAFGLRVHGNEAQRCHYHAAMYENPFDEVRVAESLPDLLQTLCGNDVGDQFFLGELAYVEVVSLVRLDGRDSQKQVELRQDDKRRVAI